jgi:transketolase C-terminal domain/subunit
MVAPAMEAADVLADDGIDAGDVNGGSKTNGRETLAEVARGQGAPTLEETCSSAGSAAGRVGPRRAGSRIPFKSMGIQDCVRHHGSQGTLRKSLRIDLDGIVRRPDVVGKE